jgi:hypothetical protein
MPKVFGIGLSRTATWSLTEALQKLGYSAVHWPKSTEEIDCHEAAADITVSCRFEELDRAYPGSKFVLTVRDIGSWIGSCLFHYAHVVNYAEIPEPGRSFALDAEHRIYGATGGKRLDGGGFAKVYGAHWDRVNQYFSDRRSDLLVLNIVAGEGWEKLCPFLGKADPCVSFPHVNQASSSQRTQLRG